MPHWANTQNVHKNIQCINSICIWTGLDSSLSFGYWSLCVSCKDTAVIKVNEESDFPEEWLSHMESGICTAGFLRAWKSPRIVLRNTLARSSSFFSFYCSLFLLSAPFLFFLQFMFILFFPVFLHLSFSVLLCHSCLPHSSRFPRLGIDFYMWVYIPFWS